MRAAENGERGEEGVEHGGFGNVVDVSQMFKLLQF